MHRVVPELIVENYRAGRFGGEFPAVGMFLDLSGFSTMTDALMQHGQHGAEVLASLMHSVFDPLVESIFDYGGKIIGFAGDGIMALYPVETNTKLTALRALASAYVIQQRLAENATRETLYGKFAITAKIGLAIDFVAWGILHSEDGEDVTYYFRGPAVDDSAHAEHYAGSGDILLTGRMNELLREQIITKPYASFHQFNGFRVEMPDSTRINFPPVDLHISRRFMPEEVIKNDVRGEFRQVVNLFMRFPDLPDASLRDLITIVFKLRKKYGGLVSRIDFGDKGCNMLMLWGAPVAYENDIGRALNFVLDLKSKVDFPITAGVTYYIAHAGYLGSAMCEDYTCYGWGVNLASRFMMSAPTGQIWVDDRIARRVLKKFDMEFIGKQMFKGFAGEQKVHLLRGYRQTEDVIYQGELVGREEELARLAIFAEPLWQNHFAGLALVSGDAGIGKGRLVHEFHLSDLFERNKTLWAVCQSNQILRQSFNPLRGWLLRYFGLAAGQSPEERKQGFDSKLDDLLASIPDLELARELDRTRSLLAALVEISWPESLYEQLDAEGRYNNTFLALIALLKAESLRQPVVLFLEDLQFTDNDTRDFLPRLKRAILATQQAYPIGIIVTSRLHGVSLAPDWIDERIDLPGLSYAALARLIETLLGGVAAPGLVSLVMDRSEGNPYFTEQIIRYLQEESLIEMSQAGWALLKGVHYPVLPGDIRAVLVARLDQLAHEVREIVQTASVLGREFEIHMLAQMLHEEENVHTCIGEAEKAAIWSPLNEIRYIFSHGLLRDAAYAMQMQARRQELHGRAVQAMEQLYANNLNHHYVELAYHAEYAELYPKAQQYYILAGKAAYDLYQNSQGIDYYTRALQFTPVDDLRTQFDLLIERVELFNRVGNRGAQFKDLETLEILAAQVNDQQRLVNAKILHARYCFTIGDYPGTIEISQQVVEMSKELDQVDLALGVYVVWSQSLFRSGSLDEAMKYATEGLELARLSGRRVEEGRSLSSLGLIALETKAYELAQHCLEEAVVIARETNERTLESRALANLANSAAYVQRDYAIARAYYAQAYSLAVEQGDRYGQALYLGNLGWVCQMLGDFASAQGYHEQALLTSREVDNLYQETYTLMNLSGVAEVQGDAQKAIEYATHALELCRKLGDRPGEAWSYLYLGHAFSLMGQFDEAQKAYQQTLNIRNELRQSALATEPIAGLIQVALRMNDISLASRLMEDIVNYLSDGGTLEGTEEPLRVYLACYYVLERMADARATGLLQTAMQLLEAQASKIDDEQSRRTYIENVPWRRAIESAWLAKKENS